MMSSMCQIVSITLVSLHSYLPLHFFDTLHLVTNISILIHGVHLVL